MSRKNKNLNKCFNKNNGFKNIRHHLPRKNICICCGIKENLGVHHVLPYCYFNKLSKKIYEELKALYPKEREEGHQDRIVCSLCDKHHDIYEKEYSNELHLTLFKKYNVDLNKTSWKEGKGSKKNPSGKPKPSEVVMSKIKTLNDYFELRQFCEDFFIEKMKPEHPIFS